VFGPLAPFLTALSLGVFDYFHSFCRLGDFGFLCKAVLMGTRFKRPLRLHSFPRLLFAEWLRLKLPLHDTIIVAVSGGADSTALLLALHELNNAHRTSLAICAAHLDHGIRRDSKEDAKWVRQLAGKMGLKAVIGRANVKAEASAASENLEQTARRLRYEFLERTARRLHAKFVLTAHTMDDQAETVLLRLIRGTAGEGLSGMDALRPLSKGSPITLVRPLLWGRRIQTEEYCHQRQIDFLHDEMNDDERFARVKIRKQLLPLMQQVNKKVVEALSRTASLLKDDGAVLINDADLLLTRAMEGAPINPETNLPALRVDVLADAPPAVRRRALRQWISNGRGSSRRLEMVHLIAVDGLLQGNKGGRVVELPNGFRIRRKKGWLEFDAEND